MFIQSRPAYTLPVPPPPDPPFLSGSLVAERNMKYAGLVTDSGGTYLNARTAMVGVSALQLTFGNWSNLTPGTGDVDGPNSYSIGACYLEHGGVATQVMFGGAGSVSITPGGFAHGTVTKAISPGDSFVVRTYVTPDTGGGSYPRLAMGATLNPGESSVKGSNLANGTGTSGFNSFTDVFGPLAITGTVTSGTDRAVAVVGDSICAGIGDDFSPGTHAGYVYRALNGQRPFLLYALPGESAAQFLTTSPRRKPYIGPAVKHLICEYIGNDLQQGGTVAQVQAALIGVWAEALTRNPVLKIWQCTCTPKSSSTDGWATTGNQTTDPFTVVSRPAVNNWIRAGAPMFSGAAVAVGTGGAQVAGQSGHPLAGYFEVADLAETSRDSGIWLANGTADGNHPTATMHATLAAGIDLTKLI